MWMPDQSTAGPSPGGVQEVIGRVDRPPQRQSEPVGFFGGRPRETVLFRLKLNTGQMLNCRFEGTLSGMLDLGDTVRVSGTIVGGVMQVTRIADLGGAVIAQSACFVATAACGDALAPEVEHLRRFRDRVLMPSAFGRVLVRVYWRFGPILASWIADRPYVRHTIRTMLLRPLGKLASRMADRVAQKDAGAGAGLDHRRPAKDVRPHAGKAPRGQNPPGAGYPKAPSAGCPPLDR